MEVRRIDSVWQEFSFFSSKKPVRIEGIDPDAVSSISMGLKTGITVARRDGQVLFYERSISLVANRSIPDVTVIDSVHFDQYLALLCATDGGGYELFYYDLEIFSNPILLPATTSLSAAMARTKIGSDAVVLRLSMHGGKLVQIFFLDGQTVKVLVLHPRTVDKRVELRYEVSVLEVDPQVLSIQSSESGIVVVLTRSAVHTYSVSMETLSVTETGEPFQLTEGTPLARHPSMYGGTPDRLAVSGRKFLVVSENSIIENMQTEYQESRRYEILGVMFHKAYALCLIRFEESLFLKFYNLQSGYSAGRIPLKARGILAMASQWGLVFVFSAAGDDSIEVRIVEEDPYYTKNKKLLKAMMFKFARDLAMQEKKQLSDIYKIEAEHYFKSGDYSKAVEIYIEDLRQSEDPVEPSHVIEKLLSVSELGNLVLYLECLEKSDHIQKNTECVDLLFQLYLKREEFEKFNELARRWTVKKSTMNQLRKKMLKARDNMQGVDPYGLSIRFGYFQLALIIAMVDIRDASLAFDVFGKMQDSKVEQTVEHSIEDTSIIDLYEYAVSNYGPDILVEDPERTTEILKKLVTHKRDELSSGLPAKSAKQENGVHQLRKRKSATHLENCKELERYVSSLASFYLTCKDSGGVMENFKVFLDFSLEIMSEYGGSEFYPRSIHTLYRLNIDPNLDIPGQSDYTISSMIVDTLLGNYRGAFQNTIGITKQYFVFNNPESFPLKDDEEVEEVVRILDGYESDIDILEGLRGLTRLKRSRGVIMKYLERLAKVKRPKTYNFPNYKIIEILKDGYDLGTVAPYLVSLDKLMESEIKKDRENISTLEKRKKVLEGEIESFKTEARTVNSGVCSNCKRDFDRYKESVFHFMCGHSFHSHCLGEARVCPRCKLENRKLLRDYKISRKKLLDPEELAVGREYYEKTIAMMGLSPFVEVEGGFDEESGGDGEEDSGGIF